MGVYGGSYTGKTLLCKGMCYELDDEFEGRVCYLQWNNELEQLYVVTNMPKTVQKIEKKEVRVLFTCNDIFDDLYFKPFNS